MGYAAKSSTCLKCLQSAQIGAVQIVFNLPRGFSTRNLFQDYANDILPVKGLYNQQVYHSLKKHLIEIQRAKIYFKNLAIFLK